MAEDKGRFLPSKAAAIEEVRRLQARGIRNIDVGCLQVNLHYHPDAFASRETAFDPEANAAYAAAFLVRPRAEARSGTRALGTRKSAGWGQGVQVGLDPWGGRHLNKK